MIPLLQFPQQFEHRIKQLEGAVDASLDLLQLVLERIEAKLGPNALGSEMPRLQSLDAEVENETEQIDMLVRDAKTAEAARAYRDAAGVSWDQAHFVVGH